MEVSMQTEGLEELEAQMKALNLLTMKSVLRKTSRESGKPVLQGIKQRVVSLGHFDTGLLLESVKMRVTLPKNPRWADAVATVGIFKDNALMRRFGLNPVKDMPPTTYGYWLEYGVQPHYTGSGSNVSSSRDKKAGLLHPGIPAKPFIRPAFDAKLNQALAIIKSRLSLEIEKALRKARR